MTGDVATAAGAARTRAGLPRLLPPVPGTAEDLNAHLARFGPRPRASGAGPGRAFIEAVRQAGLTGRGGAAFPVYRKLSGVHAAPGPKSAVANGAESEPASRKDAALLWHAPHLVLDGLQLAAEAAGATALYLYLHAGTRRHIEKALAERAGADELPVTIVEAPRRFLAGQETALVSRINGGPALPTYTPPRPSDRGVRRTPTLVQNTETLAHLALIARHGPAWFRTAGTAAEPGTMLVTLHTHRGTKVTETEIGTSLHHLINDTHQAVLIGGYHGTWLEAGRMPALDNHTLRQHSAALGAGVIAALPDGYCGLRETARVVRYLAAESAGQCGPCLNGLPRIALAMAELAGPRPSARTRADLDRWAGLAEGRGACHHPDGAVRFVRSALTTFAAELGEHASGRCTATTRDSFLPVPNGAPTEESDWR